MYPLIAGLGPTELLIILAVIVLMFGAAKLPELARGSGRALRIFKAETKGLMDDDEDDASATDTTPTTASLEERQVRLDAEAEADRIARERRDDTTA